MQSSADTSVSEGGFTLCSDADTHSQDYYGTHRELDRGVTAFYTRLLRAVQIKPIKARRNECVYHVVRYQGKKTDRGALLQRQAHARRVPVAAVRTDVCFWL